jgi:hypothetical protein
MQLRTLNRMDRPVTNIWRYVHDFKRKRTAGPRVAVLRRLYAYLITVPDYLFRNPIMRRMIIVKTREFKADARASKIKTHLNAVLLLCLAMEK